jgi:hypothetical protein
MEDVGTYIFGPFGLSYSHLVFLWPFGMFSGNLVYFSCFGMLYKEKSGSPGAAIWRKAKN